MNHEKKDPFGFFFSLKILLYKNDERMISMKETTINLMGDRAIVRF